MQEFVLALNATPPARRMHWDAHWFMQDRLCAYDRLPYHAVVGLEGACEPHESTSTVLARLSGGNLTPADVPNLRPKPNHVPADGVAGHAAPIAPMDCDLVAVIGHVFSGEIDKFGFQPPPCVTAGR